MNYFVLYLGVKYVSDVEELASRVLANFSPNAETETIYIIPDHESNQTKMVMLNNNNEEVIDVVISLKIEYIQFG